jgi:hypothetical protein
LDEPSSARPASRLVADVTRDRAGLSGEVRHPLNDAPDPFEGEARWPAWKVSVFVIVFSGACWSAIAYITSRLMG